MMEVIEDVELCETSHGLNSSSRSTPQDSLDSGYLTLTPHSGACTSITSGYRSRVSCVSSKRHHRTRVDPLQASVRPQRFRSKLNHLLNASESDYLVSESNDKDSLLHESVPSDYSSDSTHLGSNDANPRGRLRSSRSCKTTVPITPASTRLHFLSPPPSPAVPSSSFIASEPIDEDVEMKLVIVPQSTPQVIVTSPRRPRPPPRIVVSPARINTRSSSVNDHKLSKLSITGITPIAEIKPKRLDFSQRASTVAVHRTRATPDFTGRETVDIMALLGDKSNHWRIVSKIFSYLSPQDLCSVSMVSKTWRTICTNDSRANIRRLTHVILRQNAKENLSLIKKSKAEGDIQSSPKSRYARKGYLLQVQNLLQVQPSKQPPSSPPVSPSKVKFHSFVKASRTLAPWEHLLRCPKCSFPSHVDDEKNVGTCSRQGCSMEFCTSCSSRPHTGPCKTPLLATPTKRNKQRLVIGSRQSKRNLRRL